MIPNVFSSTPSLTDANCPRCSPTRAVTHIGECLAFFFSLPRQPVHRPKVGTAKLLRGQLVFRTTAISHQKAPNVANWIRRRRGADRMLEAVKPLDLRFEIWFWTKEHPPSSVDLHLVIIHKLGSNVQITPTLQPDGQTNLLVKIHLEVVLLAAVLTSFLRFVLQVYGTFTNKLYHTLNITMSKAVLCFAFHALFILQNESVKQGWFLAKERSSSARQKLFTYFPFWGGGLAGFVFGKTSTRLTTVNAQGRAM